MKNKMNWIALPLNFEEPSNFRTNNTATETFDGVMVCTGHHTDPYWPDPFPGQNAFRGKLVHSHDYKDHKVCETQMPPIFGRFTVPN